MKKLLFSAASLAIGVSAYAAAIEQVIVRQQWPWSTDIKVEYKLSGVTKPVDIAIKTYNGDVELPLTMEAVKGDVFGIAEDGVGQLLIDPVAAFGTEKIALANFKVKLTVSDSSSNIGEVLYKIFDLTAGACTDVTRKDILNGKYGAYETDYAKIGPGFSTGAQDVLIWTGVTNNPAYKTTHLVMRKIAASNLVWQCGDPDDALNSRAGLRSRHYVKLTQDYYVGVFEFTQAQFEGIYGSNPSTFSTVENAARHPVETIHRFLAHSNPLTTAQKGVITGEAVAWPTNSYPRDVTAQSFMDKLRKKTVVEFDLPTAAEWQLACGGGNGTPLYSGKQQLQANVGELSWYSGNAGSSTHEVGCRPPNAFGLYDCLGNVAEFVLNAESIHGSKTGSGTEEDPYVDPVGNLTADWANSSTVHQWYMGGSWKDDSGYWQDFRQAAGLSWYKWNAANKSFIGFRVVCPATADGQWGAHPVK